MNKANACRIFMCIFILSCFLYLYTDQQNHLTKMQFRVPAIAKEIKHIREENKRLQYEIDQFESPQNLLQFAQRTEFTHLKQPLAKEIVKCQEGLALRLPQLDNIPYTQSKATLAIVR